MTTTQDPRPATARLTVRFDAETLAVYPEETKRIRATNRIPNSTVTHYSRNDGARMPTRSRKPGAIGGKYTREAFTVVIDGEKWWGTVKQGTDIVRLRPAIEKDNDNA